MLNYAVDLPPILKLLKNHLIKSDLEEVKQILTDIQSRIKRFSHQKKRLNNQN